MPKAPDCVIIWDGRARAEIQIAILFTNSNNDVNAAAMRAVGELDGAVFLAREVGIDHAFAPELDFTERYRQVLYPFIKEMYETSESPDRDALASLYVIAMDEFREKLFAVNEEFSLAVEGYFEKKFGRHKTNGPSEM